MLFRSLTEIFKTYRSIEPHGKIKKLIQSLGEMLDCKDSLVFTELDKLLGRLLDKKPLNSFGVQEEDLHLFTENVLLHQGRLMGNAYVPLSEETVLNIYQVLY